MTTLREAAQQALEALENSETTVPYDGFGMAHREADRKHEAAITALRAAMAQQAEINVPVPNGLAQSDAEFWLRHRADIIEACRAHGLTIVTTAHGAHLMQLGKIEAQQADPAPGWCKHCKQYSIEEPLPAQQEPDLRGANPIGLTPPQKDLQRAQFRADALAQRAEPSRTQRMRDAGYTRRPTAREMVEKDEPVRELLISAAAMAVVAERKGEYKGASWVADAILETVPFSSQASQQAEPTQAPCDIAEDGVCEVIDCCRNPKQAEPKTNWCGETCERAKLCAVCARELAGGQAEPVDQTVMELAESVGLIGPASRGHDLHGAIQRFHDLIVMNASIKAAQQFAETLAQQAEPVAWMIYIEDGTSAYVTDNPHDLIGAHRALPLYTAPKRKT